MEKMISIRISSLLNQVDILSAFITFMDWKGLISDRLNVWMKLYSLIIIIIDYLKTSSY